jgi:peptidoglycan/xylan/chitin deacetylase (PgdA/CDA1 family)
VLAGAAALPAAEQAAASGRVPYTVDPEAYARFPAEQWAAQRVPRAFAEPSVLGLVSPRSADLRPSPPRAPWTVGLRCPILYAHEVPSQVGLRALVRGLQSAGYQPTRLSLVEAASAGRGRVPAGCLVLTFDDSLHSQYTNALPVLAELRVPAVFFVLPGYRDAVHRYMSDAEIREAYVAGHEVMAHTCNHPHLPALRVRGPVAFQAEIVDCKRLIEGIIGGEVPFLAYPNGSHDVPTMRAVESAGYRAAFTTHPSAYLPPGSAFALPRIRFDAGEGAGVVLSRIRQAGG